MEPAKKIQIVKETVRLAEGGILKPLQIDGPHKALQATLLMLFKHVADVHLAVVEAVSQKYDIPEADIIACVTENPKWKDMMVHPLISDLMADVEVAASPAPPPEAPTPSPPPEAPAPEAQPRKIKIRRKKAAPAPAPAPAPSDTQ